jgi:hypothetical protein
MLQLLLLSRRPFRLCAAQLIAAAHQHTLLLKQATLTALHNTITQQHTPQLSLVPQLPGTAATVADLALHLMSPNSKHVQ